MLPDIYSGLILFVLSGLSMIWCQNFAHFLPQALDIVPIAALFMWIGTFIKESVDFDNLTGLNKLVFTGLIIIWAGCFICKIYIELSTRHYPGLYLPIFEAVGGTFVVAFFAKLLPSGKVSEFFQTVGKHTLAVLCIHHLDLYWVIWGDYIQSWPVAVIVRLIVDLVLLALVIYWQHWFAKRKKSI